MEVLWRSYGIPMEVLWNNTGTTREQHGSSALAARVQVACDTGQDGPMPPGIGIWSGGYHAQKNGVSSVPPHPGPMGNPKTEIRNPKGER